MSIPESLQVALERAGLPVKERYTGHELMKLLELTTDMDELRTGTDRGRFMLTQKQVGDVMGLTRWTVCNVERTAMRKIRDHAFVLND